MSQIIKLHKELVELRDHETLLGYYSLGQIRNFIKFSRKRLGLTQQNLADRSGLSICFIRKIEQGRGLLEERDFKTSKINGLLRYFGYELAIRPLVVYKEIE